MCCVLDVNLWAHLRLSVQLSSSFSDSFLLYSRDIAVVQQIHHSHPSSLACLISRPYIAVTATAALSGALSSFTTVFFMFSSITSPSFYVYLCFNTFHARAPTFYLLLVVCVNYSSFQLAHSQARPSSWDSERISGLFDGNLPVESVAKSGVYKVVLVCLSVTSHTWSCSKQIQNYFPADQIANTITTFSVWVLINKSKLTY